MSPVPHGLDALSDSDVRDLATYFADIDHAADRSAAVGPAVARAMSYSTLGLGQEFDPDTRLYTAACASCHYNSGKPLAVRPDLALNSAVNLPDPNQPDPGHSARRQRQRRDTGRGDAELRAWVQRRRHRADRGLLRRTRTDLKPWPDLEAKIVSIRGQMSASQ